MLLVVTGKKSVRSLVAFITYWSAIKGAVKRITGLYQTISSTLNVEFAYDRRKPLIKDLNLVAEPGKTVAVVGTTGSGKSTLVKLLFRLYDPCEGSIAIDGQDVRHVRLSGLRRAIGIVPQNPTLFNGTIRENIRYARLDATDEQIVDFMEFQDGYESKVGEGGVRLSGGEVQRLAIARVLLENPKIVALDEATSAVDTLTEAEIQKALQRLGSGRTMFVIAHRLSTIVRAHKILVVREGKIVESGTHGELLAKGGEYSQLWTQ
ncbi:P-loop containing nucleoside triphosphate hydrolase protein [Bimuria novae-zelandiae CBS 107.79]|uniref:P-loop containing nucleoside triphosphate hydrolase protein n=1 Tax=Bimuria novae-zelandiae CBS 107.79 TaxID=1447943 RepID=A0A6A5VG36_9PLEO|nr:P-loop containing nucleoside triphosphate hydrolase protein [Bimuria novae-zelandiae CBS 107.79]